MQTFSSTGFTKGLPDHLGMVLARDDTHGTTLQLLVRACHLTPFNTLSGGVMLTMEETLAGILSCELLTDRRPLGLSVSANHTATAREGDTVTAYGTPVHIGKTTHVWHIDVRDDNGKLISTATVTNIITR